MTGNSPVEIRAPAYIPARILLHRHVSIRFFCASVAALALGVAAGAGAMGSGNEAAFFHSMGCSGRHYPPSREHPPKPGAGYCPSGAKYIQPRGHYAVGHQRQQLFAGWPGLAAQVVGVAVASAYYHAAAVAGAAVGCARCVSAAVITGGASTQRSLNPKGGARAPSGSSGARNILVFLFLFIDLRLA